MSIPACSAAPAPSHSGIRWSRWKAPQCAHAMLHCRKPQQRGKKTNMRWHELSTGERERERFFRAPRDKVGMICFPRPRFTCNLKKKIQWIQNELNWLGDPLSHVFMWQVCDVNETRRWETGFIFIYIYLSLFCNTSAGFHLPHHNEEPYSSWADLVPEGGNTRRDLLFYPQSLSSENPICWQS